MNKFLSDEELKRYTPSVFSKESHENTSEKYAVIPTISVIQGLRDLGFFPTKSMESSCRDKENAPYVKHTIRLRQDKQTEVGGKIPEIVLTNSHNGLCSYQIGAGIYRLVCSNGLTIGDEYFRHRVRHQGDVVQQVADSAKKILEVFPEAMEIVGKWEKIPLNFRQQSIYAKSAALLKWDQEKIPVAESQLLEPRRYHDQKNDVWTTFNIVQENLIRGGLRYMQRSKNGIRQRTREVNSVNENNRLNIALWNLTKELVSQISA